MIKSQKDVEQRLVRVVVNSLLSRIRELRKDGVTYRELADRMDVSHSLVSFWLQGSRIKDMPLQIAFERAMKIGVKMEFLLNELSPPETAMLLHLMDEHRDAYLMLSEAIKLGGPKLDLVLKTLKMVTGQM